MRWSALLRIFSRAAGILVVTPLFFASAAQAQTLAPSTSQLTLNAVANGAAPLSQIFTVAAADGSLINISTLVDAGSNGTAAPSWITVTPHLATTPAQVEVAANQAGLNAGAHPARIQFTDAKGNSLGTPVAVTLQVAAAPPKLGISPAIVNLSAPIEQGYVQEGIFLRSLGPGTLAPVTVTVVSGYPWLSAVVPACDTACAITVKAAISTISPGLHSGLLRVKTALGSTDVPVSLFALDHGPVMHIAPQGLQFSTVSDTHMLDSRTISLLNTGDGAATWTADVVAGGAWLSLDTPAGITAAGATSVITASMNSGFMAEGEYGGLIRISAVDGTFNPLYVPVVLRVEQDDAAPVPLLSSGGMVFQEQLGNQGQQLPLNLMAGSASLVDFQISAQSSGWLSAGPMRGKVSGTAPAPLNISETPLALQAGFYSGLVNVAFGAGPLRSLHVGISVVDPAAANCKPQFLYLTQTALPDGFTTRIGFPTPLEAVLVDDCGDFISNGLVNAAFSNGDPDLVFEPMGNGRYTATWMPAHVSDALPNAVATVALRGFVPALPIASTEAIGTVSNDTAPALNANSVLNNLNPQLGAPVAPGTIVQLYGSSLATTTGSGAVVDGQLVTTLNGLSVNIGGVDAPLFFGSSGQIDAQIPTELAAGQRYEVLVNANGFYSNAITFDTAAVTPGLASFADGGVIAQDTGYNLITADHPAQAGEVIILYATGMGSTNPAVATGAVAPGTAPLAETVIAPQVTVGSVPAHVLFSGLSPGSVGLYQIDVTIPAGAGTGNVPLVVTQNGVASNTVTVPLQ
jgi:uncharacterized protein (TIGR03437 family)